MSSTVSSFFLVFPSPPRVLSWTSHHSILKGSWLVVKPLLIEKGFLLEGGEMDEWDFRGEIRAIQLLCKVRKLLHVRKTDNRVFFYYHCCLIFLLLLPLLYKMMQDIQKLACVLALYFSSPVIESTWQLDKKMLRPSLTWNLWWECVRMMHMILPESSSVYSLSMIECMN